MIEKRTVVDQIEVTRSQYVQLRIGLLIVDDGVEVDCKWHRTAIEPGGDVDRQMAVVNAHLKGMGKVPVGAEDIARVRQVVAAVHTPEAVAAFRASLPPQ